jgi:uncharacterized membrane protein YcaP (DUF421 family)
MLLLSNVVQNAVIGPDNSLWGGLAGAVILIGANAIVVRLAAHVSWFGFWFRGSPEVVAADGGYDHKALTRLGLRESDLDQAILEQGGDSIGDVERISIEPGGAVLVRLRVAEQPASWQDIADLRVQLDRIEALLAERPAAPTA